MKISFLKNNILAIPEEKERKFREIFSKNKIDVENKALRTKLNKLEIQEKELKNSVSESSLEMMSLNKMTNGKYEEIVKKYEDLIIAEKVTTDSKKLSDIRNEINSLEAERINLLSSLNKKIFFAVREAYSKKYNSAIIKVKNSISIIKDRIAKNELLKERKSGFKGSFNTLKNFTSDFVKAELGKVLYTGNIDTHEEDKWERQMKREMDFSR